MIAGVVAGVVLVAGCGKKAAPSESPGDASVASDAGEPEAEAGPTSEEEGLTSYELELRGYEDAMLALGLPLAGSVAQTRTHEGRNSLPSGDGGGDVGGPRCERICDLTTNICQLRDRICELGDEHQGERRYAQACERATLDCEQATEACEGCNG